MLAGRIVSALCNYCRRYSSRNLLLEKDNFAFFQAEVEDVDKIVNFLGEYHYKQVPTLNCFDVNYKKIAEIFRNDTVKQIQDGYSFCVQEKGKEGLVGVVITHIMESDLRNHYTEMAEMFKNDKSYYHWKLFEKLYFNLDVYEMYNVPHILHGRLYSLRMDVQKKGLGGTFIQANGILAAKNIKEKLVVIGEANGLFSNKMMDKAGYEAISRVDYNDFVVDGHYPFKEIAKNTPHSFITARVQVLNKDE